MKKLWSVFLGLCAIVLCLTLLGTDVQAAEIIDSGTCGPNATWALDSDGTLTIGGAGNMWSWGFHSTAPWYSYRSSIASLVIQDGVTDIGALALYDCTSLTRVTIADSVSRIDNGAFYNCTGLTTITIPDSVTSIGGNAFYRCTSLTTITIPDSVTDIGVAAFCECTSLTDITLSNSITYILALMFENCSNLTDITIPEGVTSIGESAFKGCCSLTSIAIPEGVTTIGYRAFDGCDIMKTIFFNGRAPEIDDASFRNVSAIAYYPCSDETWTQDVRASYSGSLTWERCHNCPDFSTVEAATCTTNAIITGLCEDCGEIATTPIQGTAIGHNFGTDGWCENCGASIIILNLHDSSGDIGSPHGLKIYEDGVLITTVWIYDGQVIPITYYPDRCYAFQWEWVSDAWYCSFEIVLNNEVLFSATEDDCDWFSDDQIVFYIHHYEGVVTAPTCTEDGSTTYSCTGCGDSYVGDAVSATGHSFGEYILCSAATCTTDATVIAQCQNCELIDEITVLDSATGHSWDSNGMCTNCGAAGEIVLNLNDGEGYGWYGNYLEIYEDGVLLTKASVSFREWSKQVVISYYRGRIYTFMWSKGYSTTEYSFEIVLNNEALFSATASDCDGFASGQTVFAICGHNPEHTTTLPTCIEEGYMTHTCVMCGWSYTDSYVAATGHSFGDDGVCTTCGASGDIILNYFDYNGNALEIYEDGVLIATAKLKTSRLIRVVVRYYPGRIYTFRWVEGYGASENRIDISLNEELLYSATSSDCDSFANGQIVFCICDHSAEEITTPPACAEKGYTTHTCTTCGWSYTDSYVAATGHSFGEYKPCDDATCTKDATMAAKCEVCGAVDIVFVPNTAIGHSWEDGSCVRCGADGEIIIKMYDSYGDSWNGNALEVYEDGVLIATATIEDGSSAQASIGYYRGKNYSFLWVKGFYAEECSFEIIQSNQVLISASGDSFANGQIVFGICNHSGEEVTTLPTCTQKGYVTHSCAICGWSYADSYVDATGHSFNEYSIIRDATCTTDTVMLAHCDNCDATDTLFVPDTATGTGHTWEDGLCVRCGADGEIIIMLYDSYGYGWNGNALEIYEDGVLIATAAIEEGSIERASISYYRGKNYAFKWVKGSYAPCSFKIIQNNQVLISASGDSFEDGQTVYTIVGQKKTASISGTVSSANDTEGVTVQLFKAESDTPAYETVVYGPSATYSFSEVETGTYTIRFTTKNHVLSEYTIEVGESDVTQDAQLYLIGDVNGDRKVNMKDWSQLYNHINEISTLNGDNLKCADVNGDGKVNMKDWSRLYEHLSELNPLW